MLPKPGSRKRVMPIGLRAQRRCVSMSHAVAGIVRQVQEADGVGLSELLSALIHQGLIARLPVLKSVLPPPPTPDELMLQCKRMRDSERRMQIGMDRPDGASGLAAAIGAG